MIGDIYQTASSKIVLIAPVLPHSAVPVTGASALDVNVNIGGYHGPHNGTSKALVDAMTRKTR
jgi:hypothetical protein